MEVLTGQQMREADQFTIQNEPITSLDLMERAAGKCFEWFTDHVSIKAKVICVCGQGNNGGDGLALSRMLYLKGYQIKVFIIKSGSSESADFKTNFDRLNKMNGSMIQEAQNSADVPLPEAGTILIDAIFGTGLKRKTEGLVADIIDKINNSNATVISLDLPSGIYSDESSLKVGNKIIKADTTLTFQYLKPALLMSENAPFFGKVEVLDIGLIQTALKNMEIKYTQTDSAFISTIYKPRPDFSHKGTFGHALLIAGGEGKLGAGVLAARGFLRSGAGLLTVSIPQSGINVIQSSVPEAMVIPYGELNLAEDNLSNYKAIGIGPGIGTGAHGVSLLEQLLRSYDKPIVFDADALNILSEKPQWFQRIAKDSILTPHPGEFRRMVGSWENDFHKLKLQNDFATKYGVYVILKGKNSSIACPDGTIWFNPTGNSGMAKGGSGDILTGLLTGLLASGYKPFETCILGTWLHGLVGDLAAAERTQEGMNASDLIDFIPLAWKQVTQIKTF